MTIFNEFVDRFLQNNSTKKGYNEMVIDIPQLRKKLSHSKCIPVTIVNEKEDETETVEYLIKMAPDDYDLRNKKPYDKLYHREWFIYTDCLPEFEKFEAEKGITQEYRFKAYPKCYAISLRPFQETLILEYLGRERQFELWDKRYTMNGNHIKLVLKEYAKFHAISFAIKKQRPALMNYIQHNTRDIYMELLQKTQDLDSIQTLCDRFIETDEIRENRLYSEKFKFLKENLVKMMIDCVQNNKEDARKVLLHGGNCFNDMLFSYKDPSTKGMPNEVKFVDWQKARFGSPILDVASFLYTSLEAPTLLREEEFLTYYHNSFIKHGERLNSSLNNVYSYEEFRSNWRKYSVFGFGLAILVLYKVFMGRDYSPLKNTQDVENANDEYLLTPKYIQYETYYLRRVLDIFKHFVDKGFI